MFDWLKALQTGVAITALVIMLTSGHTLWRYRDDIGKGYALTGSLFLISTGLLVQQGYQSIQYWVLGIDGPEQIPTNWRILIQALFLSGGGVFIAVTQKQTLSVMQTFVVWSALMAMLIVMIAMGA